jgi:hypothetical protein
MMDSEKWSEWAEPTAGDTAQPTVQQVSESAQFELTTSPVLAAQPRRGGYKKLVAGLGALSLIGGATFAARTFAGQSSSTPTEAVQDMMAAAQKSDLLGMMEQLAPGERNLLIESGVPILEELKRLDVLAPSTNLNAVDAAKVTFAGQTFAELPLRDDIATVKVSGGTVTTSGSASKLSGSVIKKMAGDSLTDQAAKTTSFTTVDVVTIKRNGHWYVSGAYSLAEFARKQSGKPMPTLEQSIAAVGADTPEAALREMIEAAGSLNARKAISLLDPEEFGALQDYAPLFIDDVEKAAAKVRPKYTVTFPNLQIAATRNGNSAQVKVTNVSVDLTIPDAGGSPVHAVVEGDCVSVTVEDKSAKRCGAEVGKLIGDLNGDENGPDPFGEMTMKLDQKNQQSMTVLQRNGKWFVAPTRTVLNAVLAKMKAAKPADLQGDDGALGLFSGNPVAQLFFGTFTKPRVESDFSQISDTLPPGSTDTTFETLPPDATSADSLPVESAPDTVAFG